MTTGSNMALTAIGSLSNRVAAARSARQLRAELQRRGSSASAYERATTCDPASIEATGHVSEFLALDALERQLAELTTISLRTKMRRRRLLMPADAESWMVQGERGTLSAQGIVMIERQLRLAQRSEIIWWCLVVFSGTALTVSALASFWPY